jgi:hypothetical protein
MKRLRRRDFSAGRGRSSLAAVYPMMASEKGIPAARWLSGGLVAAVASTACTRAPKAPTPESHAVTTTFADDVAFLAQHGHLTILQSPDGGRVAVSPDYQGRVMTSAVESTGASLGFVNRTFIEQGKTATQFDNYGGEDRFWLGPEGGQFGLYFPAGKPFVFSDWQTPHALQEGAWNVTDQDASHVTFTRTMRVANYAASSFDVRVDRRVELATADDAAQRLGMSIPRDVKWIGFSTSNAITNTGAEPWTPSQGLLSIWILGMFAPSSDTRVIVPFDKAGSGEIVNDRYFGKVPADRLVVHDGFLSFLGDGHYRSKIGLAPSRAKPALGSYSEKSKLLTLVLYTKPSGATRYVNSMWETQKEPFAGDVVNSYNDGPTEPGKPSLGGFYEIESSSPAAALAPGATATHVHQTFHLTGPREALDAIATKVLGVGLSAL